MHWVAAISGIVGFIVLIIAWVLELGKFGTFFGFSYEHLLEDAKILFLLCIAFGVGTIIHLMGKS